MTTEKCPKCGAELSGNHMHHSDAASRAGYWWKSECGTYMPLDGDTVVSPLCLARQEIAALKERVKREKEVLEEFRAQLRTCVQKRDSLRADLERVTKERDEAGGILLRIDGAIEEWSLNDGHEPSVNVLQRITRVIADWAKE